MMTSTPYQSWSVLLRRLKFSSVVVALLGTCAGLLAHASSRVLIWSITGLLAIWLCVVGAVEQKRYHAYLDRVGPEESGFQRGGSWTMTAPNDGAASHGRQQQKSLGVAASGQSGPHGDEREIRRLSVLRQYERFFTRAAVVCVGIAIIGFGIGFLLRGAARWTVIGGLGIGGLWMCAMSIIIRKRIGAGPKSPHGGPQ